MKTVVVNNTSFQIPEVGDENYGENLTAFFLELAEVLNGVSAPLDIQETDFNFANNQSSPANVTGMSFPTSNVAGFEIKYIITRENISDKITESGILRGFQGDGGWYIARGDVQSDVNNTNFPSSDGDIGVYFDITSGGQVTYTSNNFPGQLAGKVTFLAKTIQQ